MKITHNNQGKIKNNAFGRGWLVARCHARPEVVRSNKLLFSNLYANFLHERFDEGLKIIIWQFHSRAITSELIIVITAEIVCMAGFDEHTIRFPPSVTINFIFPTPRLPSTLEFERSDISVPSKKVKCIFNIPNSRTSNSWYYGRNLDVFVNILLLSSYPMYRKRHWFIRIIYRMRGDPASSKDRADTSRPKRQRYSLSEHCF